MQVRGTRVTIPNTRVKPYLVDDTGRTCGWESRLEPPVIGVIRALTGDIRIRGEAFYEEFDPGSG